MEREVLASGELGERVPEVVTVSNKTSTVPASGAYKLHLSAISVQRCDRALRSVLTRLAVLCAREFSVIGPNLYTEAQPG